MLVVAVAPAANPVFKNAYVAWLTKRAWDKPVFLEMLTIMENSQYRSDVIGGKEKPGGGADEWFHDRSGCRDGR
jgi:hypothetical protein